MPHIFTNAEYADMMYVYGFCDGSGTAAVEEYRRRFPMRRIPDRRVFYKFFNTLCECGTLPSAHFSSELARKKTWRNRKTFLMWYSVAPLLTREDFQHVSVFSRTRVWRTLHEDGLYPFHPPPVQNLHPGDSAMRL